MWDHLRARRFLGLKFRRQCPLDSLIADFYCHELQLVIEVDGEAHHDPQVAARDAQRDQAFLAAGISVVHIPARLLTHELHSALQRLRRYIESRHPELAQTPAPDTS